MYARSCACFQSYLLLCDLEFVFICEVCDEVAEGDGGVCGAGV